MTQEENLNKYEKWTEREVFSRMHILPETPFFIRLDGWRFKKLSETLKVEKPFDKKIAECLVFSGRMLFKKGFNPALIFVASDELNCLFLKAVPFSGRVEKVNSVLASIVSSSFSLSIEEKFKERSIVAFDSRVIVAQNENKILEYLGWRQLNAWRNHNNAYAYWIFRKIGCKPAEIAEKLKGLKTEELHETLFKHGVNLAKTPLWQRRGILLYKEPFLKKVEDQVVTRWKIKENWKLPLFTSKRGAKLIQQILKWTEEKRKSDCQGKRKLGKSKS